MTATLSQSSERPNEARRQFALGIGLTNECNLSCSFCYRDPDRVDRLSLDQVRAAMASLPVRSVNLGTGENGMHPEFPQLLEFLRHEPIKLTITSNGYSIKVLDDDQLAAFKDVEFSLDYPIEGRTGQPTRRRQLGPAARTGCALPPAWRSGDIHRGDDAIKF